MNALSTSRRSLLLIYILCNSFSYNGIAQHSENPLVVNFFQSLYQYDFQGSKTNLAEVNRLLKGRLETEISNSNYYWWLMMTGTENEMHQEGFQKANQAIIDQCASRPPEKLTEDEIFAVVHAYAYQTRYALYKKWYIQGLSNLKKIMPYLEVVLKSPERNEKFMLLAGLYHYLSAVTIEQRPMLRPFFALGPDCNRKLGYELLGKASSSSHPLISIEAKYFLMKINLEVAGNYYEARKWSQALVGMFPNNLLFRYYLLISYAELKLPAAVQSELQTIKRLSAALPGLNRDQRSFFIEEATAIQKKQK